MRLLRTAFHPDISKHDINPDSTKRLTKRHAARAIVIRGDSLLLLYTERYLDYSLPGGGIDKGEDSIVALERELKEETGAMGIKNIKAYARYDEYRPWYKDNSDIIHMISYCYTCDIDEELGETDYEQYEIKNGMKPLWINIHEAIAHNENIIANSDKKGLSIDRETFLLKVISEELINKG